MKMRSVRLGALACALLVSMAGGSARAAHEARHCAFRLQPISRTGHVVRARLEKIGCYDTLSASLSAGTGGAVRVAAGTQPSDLTDRMVSTSGTRTVDVVIGIEYAGVGYNEAADSRVYLAPDTCDGTSYEVAYVGDRWNDDFASGKGFGGCDHNKKFQDSNFGGDVLTCTPNCSDYGTLRNEVSSLRWKP